MNPLEEVKPSVIVTGATGHIGNNLVRLLVKGGFRTGALVRNSHSNDALDQLPVSIHLGDLSNQELLTNIFDQYDVVCHLAGYISVMPRQRELLNFVNIEGTRNVLQATIESDKRLIYMSSSHAIPIDQSRNSINEDVPITPQDIKEDYGRSKAIATKLVQDAVNSHLLQATILHPTGVIGPLDFKVSNIGQVIKAYKKKGTYFYIDGTYDFVDVRDVSLATLAAITNKPPKNRYILSGHQVSVFQLLEYLSILSGRNAPSIKIPVRIAKSSALVAGYVAHFTGVTTNFTKESIGTLTSGITFDSSLARQDLGHIPRDWKISVQDQYLWLKNLEAD